MTGFNCHRLALSFIDLLYATELLVRGIYSLVKSNNDTCFKSHWPDISVDDRL